MSSVGHSHVQAFLPDLFLIVFIVSVIFWSFSGVFFSHCFDVFQWKDGGADGSGSDSGRKQIIIL